MEISLLVRNIVVIGTFSPSKFDKFYFVKNEIFAEEEILDDSYFNEQIVQIYTDKYNIRITSNQLIIRLINLNLDDDIDLILRKIVEASEILATGLGVNYDYYMFTEGRLDEISKKYFYHENNRLLTDFFNTDNVGYGYYVSKYFGKSRLKLDIKPGFVTKTTDNDDDEKEEDIISFSFNFHVNINSANSKQEILEVLKEVSDYKEESGKIMAIYE